ncbi:MAG: GFA family protein [Sandaracinaceae bacterium]
MQEYRGECLCGAVRYRVRAEAPRAMYLCHCTRCRKETGTIHGANVFFRDGELEYERGEAQLSRFALEGTRKKRVFCSTCGSPMPRQDPNGMIVLPAGSLDDDHGLEPTAHIFCNSRAGWTDRAERAERLPEGPQRG